MRGNKKLIVLLVLFIMLLSAVVVPATAKSKSVRLTVENKSSQPVNLQLVGSEFFYLTIKGNSTKIFTVNRETYDRTTWACDLVSTGTLNMKTQVTLKFMPCKQSAPNQGTPTFEKVSLFDSPTGIHWRYQDDELDQIIE